MMIQQWAQILGLGFLLVFLANCSGDQQQEEVVQQELGQDQEEEMAEEESQGQEEMAEEEVIEEPVADVVEEPLEDMANTAPAEATPAADRVVRYVNQSSVDIYSDASGSQVVGNLRKGDRVLVIMEGDWAKISDTMFLKGDQLSGRAVPRERTKRKWHAPSH